MQHRGHYIFYSSIDGDIVCEISCEEVLLKGDLIKSVMEQLYATDMVSSNKTTLYINFTKHLLLVTFCNPTNKNTIKNIKFFITWLDGQDIKELHENQYSNWFYTVEKGSQILNVRNFTEDIKKYLDDEHEAFISIIKHSDYTTLVEIGCGVMVNLKVALENKNLTGGYIGVDVNGKAINDAREKISKMSNLIDKERIRVKCGTIKNLQREDLELLKNEKPILLFPFNLIGNVAPISLLICNMIQSRLELIISIYDNTNEAVTMRSRYYDRCGYKNVTYRTDKTKSTIFESQEEHFYTVSYDYMYIEGLISSFGYMVRHYDIHNGKVLHATLQ